MTSCADAWYFCYDDSALVALGATPGWVRSRCPYTCGLCDGRCSDKNDLINSISEGTVTQGCSQLSFMCADDSLWVNEGLPEGMFRWMCPATCGQCECEDHDDEIWDDR